MVRHQRGRSIAAGVAICILFGAARSSADPVNVGDPADASNQGATGVFAEGASPSAQPDPVTGIMRYTYRFELPAARGGPQPALALTYSSSSRDREAGYGWGLGVPSIEQRPMSGNPRFDDSPSDDRFVFEGQPLVRICTIGSSEQCPSDEILPSWVGAGWGYYRLQVEGMFARFFRGPKPARDRWLVQLKGGQRMEFGAAGGSNGAVELIDGRPVRWRLVRHLDAVHPSNSVTYRWKKLGSRGLAYLTDIFDTPLASGQTSDGDFAHHTQLTWESPDYAQTSYADPLHATPDLRLSRVGISSKTWLGGGAREVLRIYSLRYAASRAPLVPYSPPNTAPLWHHSFLREIQMEGKCRASEDGQGKIPATGGCISLPATKFEYEASSLDVIASGSPVEGGPPDLVLNRQVFYDEESVAVIDFNRDGMPDVVQGWESGPTCAGNAGATFVSNDGHRIVCSAPGHPLVDTGDARPLNGYINRGVGSAYGNNVKFAYQCMNAGESVAGGDGRSPAALNAGHWSAFFTSQGGATLAGAWSQGVALWVPSSIPSFAPPAFLAEPINGGFGGYGCDRANFDLTTFHPRWQWRVTDGLDWARPGSERPGNTGANWFVDIDGDGLIDEISKQSESSGQFQLGGTKFTRRFAAGERGGAADPVQRPFHFSSATFNDSLVPAPGRPNTKYWYVDMNGDGLVDLVTADPAVNGGLPRVRLGDGRGKFSCDPAKQPSPWTCVPAGADFEPGYDIEILGTSTPLPSTDFLLHDVTGDGLADIVQYKPNHPNDGGLYVWANIDGRRFSCASDVNPNCMAASVFDAEHATFNLGPRRLTFADMDADGVDDPVIIARGGVFVARVFRSASSRASRPGLLTRIDNGIGATTHISYKTIQQIDAELGSGPGKWEHHSRAVEAVVTEITTRDTAGASGSPLPEPYRFERNLSYEYRDPAYDRWTRTFTGFRKVSVRVGGESAVTVTTNWFGPCQNDSFYSTPGDQSDISSRRCAETSDDDSAKARTGRPIRIDRLVPGLEEKHLWSQRIVWTHDITHGPDRSVQFSYAHHVETRIYDDALPVAISDPVPGSGGGDPVEPLPTQPGSKLLTTRVHYDNYGNLVRTEELGLAGERDTRTITDRTNFERDDPPGSPAPLSCSAEWVCNPTYVTTFGAPADASGSYSRVRQVRLTYESSQDRSGGITKVEASNGNLVVPTLNRHHESGPSTPTAPYPADASGLLWRTLATALYDTWGNPTQIVRGPNSASPMCTGFAYDDAYRHLPKLVAKYKDGCGSSALNTSLVFDRGFGRISLVADPSMAITSFDFDSFGRTQAVYVPERDSTLGFTTVGAVMTYTDSAPLPFVQAAVYASPTDSIRSVTVLNGLGEQVLRFDQDDATRWILQSYVTRNGSGQPQLMYRPSFYTGDPVVVATNAVAPPPSTESYLIYAYDSFGRAYSVSDSTAGIQAARAFHPLAVETRDADQLIPGQHSTAYTRTELDGHGRVRRTVQHTADGDISTFVDFYPTGEPAKIARIGGTAAYERTLTFDPLGRMVHNQEPNTGGDWRYAWDDAGRLVGTSDARGCGKNLFYDGLGRLLAEDYSPCLASHAPYSTPNLATGSGLEVYHRYDTYEPGQLGSDPAFPEVAGLGAGRLVSVRDRGSHTRFNYDTRGSTRRLARRVATPAGFSSSDPYTPHWFESRSDYDGLNRIVRRTSGADNPYLWNDYGQSEELYSYSKRGLLRAIESSYGPLVASIDYDADGLVSHVAYGDGASTHAILAYDPQRRLATYDVIRHSPPPLWSTNNPPDYPRPNWDTTQTDLARFRFTYDAVGNPTSVVDITDPDQYRRDENLPVYKREIAYDDLYRVRAIWYAYPTPSSEAKYLPTYLQEIYRGDTRPVPLQAPETRVMEQTFSYDALGNIVESTDDRSARFDRSLGAVSHGSATVGPNQIRSASGIQARHDAAGNLVELKVERAGSCMHPLGSRCAQWFAYDWDEVGQLARARRWDYESTLPSLPAGALPAESPAWDLRYAYSMGIRVLKSAKDELGVERHAVDVFDTLRLQESQFNAPSQPGDYQRNRDTMQVFLAGGLARAFYDSTMTLPRAPGLDYTHVYLQIPDHLGSSTAVIDLATGELVERTTYQGYGAVESDFRPSRWKSAREPFKFTGKEDDVEVGLTYFGARYYAPYIQRWVSPDPLTVHELTGELNPYAYVGGRVMSYVDPLGLCEVGAFSQNGDATVTVTGCPESPIERSEINAERHVAAAELANALQVERLTRHGTAANNAWSPPSNQFGYPPEVLQSRDQLRDGYGPKEATIEGTAVAVAVAVEAAPALAVVEAEASIAVWGALQRLGTVGRFIASIFSGGAAATASKASCFGEGTLVETCSDGAQPIETLRVGDEVLSRNDSTGAVECAPVTQVFERIADDVAEISFSSEGEFQDTVLVTLDHPFWVEGRGWTAARALKAGDHVWSTNGGVLVSARGNTISSHRVFNIEVERNHSYFVGDEEILVHNQCSPPTAAARFDPARAGHIFRGVAGHVNPRSVDSQARFIRLFEQVASNMANLRGDAVEAGIITQDAAAAGVQAFTWTGNTGQIWVTVRDGLILNAGVNPLGGLR